jgi:hypothetical protein
MTEQINETTEQQQPVVAVPSPRGEKVRMRASNILPKQIFSTVLAAKERIERRDH